MELENTQWTKAVTFQAITLIILQYNSLHCFIRTAVHSHINIKGEFFHMQACAQFSAGL